MTGFIFQWWQEKAEKKKPCWTVLKNLCLHILNNTCCWKAECEILIHDGEAEWINIASARQQHVFFMIISFIFTPCSFHWTLHYVCAIVVLTSLIRLRSISGIRLQEISDCLNTFKHVDYKLWLFYSSTSWILILKLFSIIFNDFMR